MIPARLGSKRIPKKNLRYLNGKPLIQYAIDLAKESNCFEEIWVNSESIELEKFAKFHGVNFHKRPSELANDVATNQQFTEEFLKQHDCDYVVMINTTSPLIRVETIKQFVTFLKSQNYDTVFSVVDEKAESFYKGIPLNFNLEKKVNSQLLNPVSKIVWALTAWRREIFLRASVVSGSGVFAGKYGLFPIPKDESCDLDTLEDWAIAEGMFEARNKKIKTKYWTW